jgi:hypothetical protein
MRYPVGGRACPAARHDITPGARGASPAPANWRMSIMAARGLIRTTPTPDRVGTDQQAGFVHEMASEWHVPRGDEEALINQPG